MTDRKYKQRGYMEREQEQQRRDKPQAPRERREGPRGRGLGAPTATVWRCRVCGTEQAVMGTVGPDATCTRCGGDLHTCTNCAHFDSSQPKECRKPVEERVTSKSKRNRCELFSPAVVQVFASEGRDSSQPSSDPRAAFDALFKK